MLYHMTPAALLHFLTLASQHTLTEGELLAALRSTRGQRHEAEAVALAAVETAVAGVLALRQRAA